VKKNLKISVRTIFFKDLVGVNFLKIKRAVIKVQEGDSKDYEELLQKAAELNETSPEGISNMIGDLLM